MKRILVVDDEEVVRRVCARTLAGPGRALTLARGVAEARSLLEDLEPDLLVTDLHLPDGCGTEVIVELRRRLPRAPVLVITGSLTPEETLSGTPGLEGLPCLAKPFGPADLKPRVDALLGAGSTGR